MSEINVLALKEDILMVGANLSDNKLETFLLTTDRAIKPTVACILVNHKVATYTTRRVAGRFS